MAFLMKNPASSVDHAVIIHIFGYESWSPTIYFFRIFNFEPASLVLTAIFLRVCFQMKSTIRTSVCVFES